MSKPAGCDPAAPGPAARRRAGRMLSRAAGVLSIRLAGHPLYAWLLWGAGALVLASSPVLLADPALWRILVDPELLVLMVIVGAQYARLTIGMLRLPRRGAARGARPARARRPEPGPGCDPGQRAAPASRDC